MRLRSCCAKSNVSIYLGIHHITPAAKSGADHVPCTSDGARSLAGASHEEQENRLVDSIPHLAHHGCRLSDSMMHVRHGKSAGFRGRKQGAEARPRVGQMPVAKKALPTTGGGRLSQRTELPGQGALAVHLQDEARDGKRASPLPPSRAHLGPLISLFSCEEVG
eukprot:scaffold237304_cov28-Tisochrysis_lutea.AAC.3